MISTWITIIAALTLIIFAESYSKNKHVKKLTRWSALLIVPLNLLIGGLFDHWVAANKRDLALIESREKLSIVLNNYESINNHEISRAKASAKEIKIAPSEILKMAVLAEDGSFQIAEDTLVKKYYTYTWFESGLTKYDEYFRGNEFQRRKIEGDYDGVQWVTETRTSGGNYYKANVEISFNNYNFKRQAFEVEFKSSAGYSLPPSIARYQGSGFSEKDISLINEYSPEYKTIEFDPVNLVLFSDGKRRIDSAVRHGNSLFSTTFSDVYNPAIRVSEKMHKL